MSLSLERNPNESDLGKRLSTWPNDATPPLLTRSCLYSCNPSRGLLCMKQRTNFMAPRWGESSERLWNCSKIWTHRIYSRDPGLTQGLCPYFLVFISINSFCKEAFSFPSWFVGRHCVVTWVVSGLSFQRSFTLQLLSCLDHFSRSLGTHFHFCISLFKPHLSPLSRWKSEAHIDKDNEHKLLALSNDNNR